MTKAIKRGALALVPAWSAAQMSIRDDLGRTVQLKKRPERIVTLAPFLTELVYAAGAGDQVVAVSKLSDFPPDARKLPQLGTGAEFSLTQLTTISGTHFMTEALDICRADNVFKDLSGSAPQVTVDELYEKDPFVIVGAGSATNLDEFGSNWTVRQGLKAVKDNRLVFVDSGTFQRPTPRTPEGIALLCKALDEVRPQAPRQPQQREAAPNAPPATQRPSQFGM